MEIPGVPAMAQMRLRAGSRASTLALTDSLDSILKCYEKCRFTGSRLIVLHGGSPSNRNVPVAVTEARAFSLVEIHAKDRSKSPAK